MQCAEAIRLNKRADLPAEVLEHLDQNEADRQAVMDFYASIAAVGYDTPTSSTTTKSQPTQARIFQRLALLILAAGLAWLSYSFWQKSQTTASPETPVIEAPAPAPLPEAPATEATPAAPAPSPPAKTPEQPTPAPSDKVIYAANFEPLDYLEGQLGTSLRSSQTASGTLAPENGHNIPVNTTTEFIWPESGEALTFVLLNNQGDELLRTTTSAPFSWISKVKPGRYYWKLETEEELQHVGQFFVRDKTSK